MKRIICSICITTLALSVTAWAKEDNGNWRAKGKSTAHTSTAVRNFSASRSAHVTRNVGHVNSSRSFTNAQFNGTSNRVSSHLSNNNAVVRRNTVSKARVNAFHQRNLQSTQVQTGNNVTVSRARNFEVNRSRNLTINRGGNFSVNGDRSFAFNRQRNGAINNNWRGQQFSGQNYSAFRNYHRQWHDQNWWRRNHSRISFYFGAPYYWDSGYWYPAWGYYPDYVYEYDGPIYGYNDLAPDQVVVNVQAQLQRDGYYPGAIDGVLGPMTRRAIAAYQADHGLAITSSIDEPTLETLGLV